MDWSTPLGRISLTAPLDATVCGDCGEGIWLGWEECPQCGADREPGTEDQAHFYRARVAVLGPLVRTTREVDPAGAVPVTDAQYASYVTGSGTFDAELLEEIVDAAGALDLEDVESTRSAGTREAARRLERSADRVRRVLTDLKVMRPSGRFAEVHPHVIGSFEGFQRMLRSIALGLTSWHPQDIFPHAEGIQGALDEASDELETAAELWEEAAGDLLLGDTPEDRMASLTGGRPAGEVRTLSDLTAVGLGGFGEFVARGPEGYRYFADLMRTPLEEMPDEAPSGLYLLALLVNSFDDPTGIRSRASLFLDALHEARAQEEEAMLRAAVSVQASLGEAGATLANVGPLVEALLQTPGVPEDALRTFLLDTYKNLTEGCFRHVANLFLFALFVNRGSPKIWESVADWAGFGEKYHWLKGREEEPAVAAALEGVEKIVRNSDAHCTFEHLEGGVRLVQTAFHGDRPPTKTERVLDDAELGDLLTDLLRTVLSLSIAAQLFQLDHMREISRDLHEAGTKRALRPTFLQLFVGIFGLVEPRASEEGGRAEVRASVAGHLQPSPVEEYLKCLVFVASLHRESEVTELAVEHRGEWFCSVAAPTERLLALTGGSDPASVLALLLSTEASWAEAPARTDDEKLRQLGIPVGSRMLVHHLVEEVEPLFHDARPEATEGLRRAARMLEEFEAALLLPRDVGEETRRLRDRLIAATKEMKRFLVANLRVRGGVFKDAQAVARAEKHYRSGAGMLNGIAASSPTLERLW